MVVTINAILFASDVDIPVIEYADNVAPTVMFWPASLLVLSIVTLVAAIFGCWTSVSRKAVKQVVERHNHLLFYPVQYECLEQSPNIIYFGPRPISRSFPPSDGAWPTLAAGSTSSARTTCSPGRRTRSSASN